ncbi:MAG: hypothetical protein K8H85_13265, partial [Cyclobacteriaceae bacterium]|nr:hypothetical protein [Cyclobacteriaceae bacterium]
MIVSFMANNEMNITYSGDIVSSGYWESYGDSGNLELEIELSEEYPFDLLNQEWDILNYSEDIIELTNAE